MENRNQIIVKKASLILGVDLETTQRLFVEMVHDACAAGLVTPPFSTILFCIERLNSNGIRVDNASILMCLKTYVVTVEKKQELDRRREIRQQNKHVAEPNQRVKSPNKRIKSPKNIVTVSTTHVGRCSCGAIAIPGWGVCYSCNTD